MVIYETAPAKLNLSLDVLRKRKDGFHDVEMVLTTIDLSDRVELQKLNHDDVKVSIDSRYVPEDERNLAYQAAQVLKETYDLPYGVHIKIDKEIPVSAGLGGGSCDAAAVFRGLNRLWDLGLSLEELASVGKTIGSDVPFCVHNKTALAQGRGEKLTFIPPPPLSWVVLAKPDIGVSTKDVFSALTLEGIKHPDTTKVVTALESGNFQALCEAADNSLEQTAISLYPEIGHIKEKMYSLGSKVATMSGSGPTVYGLFQKERPARRIYNSLQGFCDEVYIVRTLRQ
ncbi:MAG TPA: 4-(cytidine 5'-diphospho)-2-C-methyl-D-erythritol kinase [Bacillota bacterium]|nr:4-(cytidine 5'-diphospho)-2-C-methyl-D-erythritol kinase [Bacillota bacterium]